MVVLSMDQSDFVSLASQPTAHSIVRCLVDATARLESAGADFFLVCANGAHRFAAEFLPQVGIPFVSIVDATAERVRASGIRTVGLLGVKQTMAGTFYPEKLAACGVEVLVPPPEDQERIHEIIYSELVQNRITAESREFFVRAMQRLVARGAAGVILGCTEIPLILSQQDVEVPVFDTAQLHCEAAVEFAFRGFD